MGALTGRKTYSVADRGEGRRADGDANREEGEVRHGRQRFEEFSGEGTSGHRLPSQIVTNTPPSKTGSEKIFKN